MNCEERKDLILFYAADALDPDEAAGIRAHLQTECPRCLGFLAEASAALTHLSLALDPVAPPPEVEERLMARVRSDVRAHDRLPARRSGPRPGRAAPPRQHAWSEWRRPLVAAGLAAFVTFLVVGVPARDQIASLEDELAQAVALVEEREASATVKASALRVVTSSEVKLIALNGPALKGRRSGGRLFWDWHTGDCYLHATGLRSPGDNKVYALWFTDVDGEAMAAGTFSPDEKGDATFLTLLPSGIDVFAPVFITVEPAAGSEKPSASHQLSGQLESL